MNNLPALVSMWTLTLTACLFLLYDWNHDMVGDWLAENDVMYPVYPWWVRLDHWLYHVELCRIQHHAFEQHRLFGARLNILGKYVMSLR